MVNALSIRVLLVTSLLKRPTRPTVAINLNSCKVSAYRCTFLPLSSPEFKPLFHQPARARILFAYEMFPFERHVHSRGVDSRHLHL